MRILEAGGEADVSQLGWVTVCACIKARFPRSGPGRIAAAPHSPRPSCPAHAPRLNRRLLVQSRLVQHSSHPQYMVAEAQHDMHAGGARGEPPRSNSAADASSPVELGSAGGTGPAGCVWGTPLLLVEPGSGGLACLGLGCGLPFRAGMKRAHREPGRHTPLCVTNQITLVHARRSLPPPPPPT
jgi:hypothetical protein